MSNTTDEDWMDKKERAIRKQMKEEYEKEEQEVEKMRKAIFEAVKSLVGESLWVNNGGDYEGVFGDDAEFDAGDLAVKIRGKEFKLCLLPRSDLHRLCATCDIEVSNPTKKQKTEDAAKQN